MKENSLVEIKKQVVDVTEKRIADMVSNSELELPKNYSASNALKSAWLILQDIKDKTKQPALLVCDKTAIANSLFKMVTLGLNPAKNQCYFIAYGKQLNLSVSYLGNIMMAKTLAGAKEVRAVVVYAKDKIETKLENTKYSVVSHEQNFFGEKGEPIGAYATIFFEDESLNYTELMTLDQIKKAWSQGYGYKEGDKNSTHVKFREEMMKKTVINRACKNVVKTTSDDRIKEAIEDVEANEFISNSQLETAAVENKIKTEANTQAIDFDSVNLETGEILDIEENKEEVPATAPVNEEEVPF